MIHSLWATGMLLAIAGTADAFADTVQSTGVIYAAGTQAPVAGAATGTAPTAVTISSGTSYFTFNVSGTVTLNNGSGNNVNDADGFGAAVSTSYNSGAGSISGLTAPNAGFLTGVFVGAGGPSGAAPAALNFLATGLGTSFASLSPMLDQAFFIGDGLTGDGMGSVQDFYVPTGATTLYLGISDACGYNGPPSCYYDNLSSFTVTERQVGATTPVMTTTPEPSSLMLLGTGVLGVAGMMRRRLQRF